MRKIKLWINTGFAGQKHIDYADLPDEWDDLSEDEQNEHLDTEAREHLLNHVHWGAYLVDDQEEDE